MKRLLWKEWHEQQWKVWLCTAAVLLVNQTLLRSRLLDDYIIALRCSVCGVLILSFFISIDVFCSETENKTNKLLSTLPISPLKIFSSKMLVAFSTVLIACIAGMLQTIIITGEREISNSLIFIVYVGGLFCGISMMCWYALYNVNAKSEVGSAGLGLLVFVLTFSYLAICAAFEVFRPFLLLSPCTCALLGTPEANRQVATVVSIPAVIAFQLLINFVVLSLAFLRYQGRGLK